MCFFQYVAYYFLLLREEYPIKTFYGNINASSAKIIPGQYNITAQHTCLACCAVMLLILSQNPDRIIPCMISPLRIPRRP